jgi:predicted transcriptional regulator
MVSSAEDSVKIVTPFRPREITNKAIEMIKDARSRGVDIKIITSKKLEKQFDDVPCVKTFKEDPSMKLHVRFRELPQVFMLITDECEVLFSSFKGKGISFIPQNILGISTKDQELIKFCTLIFDYFFSISEE